MRKEIGFFVIGAQKAGTTSIHNYLALDGRVTLPDIKETHFFNDGHGEYHLGIDFYFKSYFPRATDGDILGEVDPEYLFFPETPFRIKKAFPGARIIVVLRDPVARAYSHYMMTYRRGKEHLDFAQALKKEGMRVCLDSESASDFSYFNRGLYDEQIERYFEVFGKDALLVLKSHKLNSNPDLTLERIYRFIGLSPLKAPVLSSSLRNEGGLPISMALQRFMAGQGVLKKFGKAILPNSFRLSFRRFLETYNRRSGSVPQLSSELEAELRRLYLPSITRLERLTDMDFSEWK